MAAHRAGQRGRDGRGSRDARDARRAGDARAMHGADGAREHAGERGPTGECGAPGDARSDLPGLAAPGGFGDQDAYGMPGGCGDGSRGRSGRGAYGTYRVDAAGRGGFPGAYTSRSESAGIGEHAGERLVRICDLAGRPRGTGFLVDADGTLLTSHEAVDGLARLVLHAPGGRVCLAESDAVTPLPELGLALVATEGLGVAPLPVAPHAPAHPERRFLLRLPHRAEGMLLGAGPATYTATDRYHLLPEVYELALADPRIPPQASGTPLIDAATGAVLAVLATALQCGHRAAGFAIPLRTRDAPVALAAVLARNAATVPVYGAHLNLAGALRLTGVTVGAASGSGGCREWVERPELARAFAEFLDRDAGCGPLVLGLAGPPGSGRSTELARLAARRARGGRPAPTVWLRGADLRPGDGGIQDAAERALRGAARIVAAATPGDLAATADLADPARAVADLAAAAGRPLLIVLDAPEEMPPALVHALPGWTAGTAAWLRSAGARLIVGCGPEFWEQAGALLPPELLQGPTESGLPGTDAGTGPGLGTITGHATPGAVLHGDRAATTGSGPRTRAGGRGEPARGDRRADAVRDLPPCVRIGDLDAEQAALARSRYGLRAADLAPEDAAHPLALRLLSEVRSALPDPVDPDEGAPPPRPPTRVEIFSAHLDLVCSRIAVRLADASELPPRGTALRRLAARVAGRVHEAARYCLGPGQGELDREAFEEVFPWRTGWASAVLAEGLLVPAGAGYRFAHEEWADWLQGFHLDVPAALEALVHRWFAPADDPVDAPVRLPSRPGAHTAQADQQPPPVPPAPAVARPAPPRSLPVPRHRAAPVVQALLLTPPADLAAHLLRLVAAVDHPRVSPTQGVAQPPDASDVAVRSADAPVPGGSAPEDGRGVPAARCGAGGALDDAGRALPGAAGAPVPAAGGSEAGAGDAEVGSVAHAAGGVPYPRRDVVRAAGRSDDVGASPVDAVARVTAQRPGAGTGTDSVNEPGEAVGSGLGSGSRQLVTGGGDGCRAGDRLSVQADGQPVRAACDALPADSLDCEADTVPNPRTRRAARPEQVPLVRPPDLPAAVNPADARQREAAWWAAHLLREALLGAADATAHRAVLRALAERIVVRSVESGGFDALAPSGLAAFGPPFWSALALPAADRLDVLRLLLPADCPPPAPRGVAALRVPGASWAAGFVPGAPRGAGSARGASPARFLAAAADVVGEAAGAGLRAVCGWLDDDRPLQGAPRLTVASAAQALLHTHRRLDVDALTEALVAAGRPGADEVLAALAEDEPSAMCRAVDRWAHDERPDRHVAAAAYGERAAARARSTADRELLRYAALAILARHDDRSLHGAALGLLVRDPGTRARHLPAAVRAFTAGDRTLPAAALAAALPTHPEPVLAAFQTRLRDRRSDAVEVLAELARPGAPALARRAAVLVADLLRHRPDQAAAVARYLDLRLEQGPAARTVLLPLTGALLREHPATVRAVLAPVFAAPGSHMSRPLRQELLDLLLAAERDPDVLEALLDAAAAGARQQHPLLTRDLVHRVGLLLGRTAQGAARFDRRIVRLADAAPDFAALVRDWLADGGPWDAVIGPSARRRLEERPAPDPLVPCGPGVRPRR